ncbi:iron-siderophore ABC transporter substrate-binding protein [Motilimonas cestriensis]|uniref:Iron-siderophore ABC transporter substrate-binding protein n=1 Tax=Motilimonas cestriensis TaxID=2742685 RepID=A0ABS8WFD3_9GAMM|nr:iron-siderophore ABC transporter substrate-binding protein [Motilimonas cestriensis]MCE2597008.1 iron-siderophore ABC transporter substrate-binding protein [Motilimonas cestriensis]
MLFRHAALALALIFTSITASAEATRVVKDAQGNEVIVPETPLRVITLSEIDLDATIALGMTPIGTVNGRGQQTLPRYLMSEIAGPIQIVGDLNRPNMEAILELEPDLILTMPNRPEVIALLNEIAPTVVTFSYGENWQNVFTRTANILNRNEQASAFMTRYNQAVTDAKAAIGDKLGQSISVVRWNPKGPAYMFRDSFASQVIYDAGMVRPPHQQDKGHTHSQSLSLEALHHLEGDWMVIGTLSTNGEAVDAMEQAKSTPAFKQLQVIQAQRYAAVDGSLWTSVGGPLAALSVLKDIVNLVNQPTATPLARTLEP